MDNVIEALALEGEDIASVALEQSEPIHTEQKKLQRELKQEALTRLEEAARTERDFAAVIAWWDRLDANRERRERYHELSRSGDELPLDYGAVIDGPAFPSHISGVLEQQIRKGDFDEAIYYCPHEIQELVSTDSLYRVLSGLSDERKELLFQCAIQRYSTAQISHIRGQSDRNIRKVRNTMFQHIWTQLFAILLERERNGLPLTREERLFLEERKHATLDKSKDGT
jgi:hypothetical protein